MKTLTPTMSEFMTNWNVCDEGATITKEFDNGYFVICKLPPDIPNRAQVAKYIVKAVNEYQKLLDSNREMLAICEKLKADTYLFGGMTENQLEELNEAIANAKNLKK